MTSPRVPDQAAHDSTSGHAPTQRPAAWCPGTIPSCPSCGSRLYVAVDRNQTMRGLCRNRANGQRCTQHYVAMGIGGDVTVVMALTADEFHALAAGRKIAGVQPEGVTWRT